MFYNNTFVGNFQEALYGDFKAEAKSLQEIKSLIEKLSQNLETFTTHNAPREIVEAYQTRLMEVVQYFVSMGGNIAEDSTRSMLKAKGKK